MLKIRFFVLVLFQCKFRNVLNRKYENLKTDITEKDKLTSFVFVLKFLCFENVF